jgi:hypothetical protein
MAGMWRQHQCWDGTYTLDDLMDAHEVMDLKEENERRAHEYLAQQRSIRMPE